MDDEAVEELCNQTSESWDWVYAMQPAYMSLICALGVAGNALVLTVFCPLRRRRRGRPGTCGSVADIYLGNLALADLLMLSCLPFWVVTVVRRFDWAFGEPLCQLVNLVIGMNYYCSVLFLTLVSVDRYLVLTRPLTGDRLRGVWRARGLCLGVWVAGALLSLPALLFRTVRFFPELGVEACYVAYPHQGWRVRYNLTVNLLGFVVPVPVVTFCCVHVLRVLRESRAMGGRRMGRGGEEKGGAERKAARLVLVVLGVFVLCWLPYQVVIFLDTLYYYGVVSGCAWSHGLDIGAQLSAYLGYSNSSLNPFLYVIVGKHFRQRARAALGCRKSWRRKGSRTANLNMGTRPTYDFRGDL